MYFYVILKCIVYEFEHHIDLAMVKSMKNINNITEKLSDDLKVEIMPQSKVSIAADCFSVYLIKNDRVYVRYKRQ